MSTTNSLWTIDDTRNQTLEATIRTAFWIAGTVMGAIIAYNTRYYINGDALTYIEMGESVRSGNWWGLANLTYSPGYPLLIGLFHSLARLNPLNEVPFLKIVNWLCLLAGMTACDMIMTRLKRELNPLAGDDERPLPTALISLLGYGMFLVGALDYVRVSLISPDLLMTFLVMVSVLIILWIKDDPRRYIKYSALGAVLAVAYVSKAWFLMFSPAMLIVAALISGKARDAVPRLFVAVVTMAVVAAPLVAALSYRMGRFSYGELSKYAYVYFISGKGEITNPPKILSDNPKVEYYDYWIPCTYPAGFDICYWHIGLYPNFDLMTHAKVVWTNTVEFLMDTPLLAIIGLWFWYQCVFGSFRLRDLWPLSTAGIFLTLAAMATCFFLSIHIDKRYWSPFFFLGFIGLLGGLRYPREELRTSPRVVASAVVLGIVLSLTVVQSVFHQSVSGLYRSSGKPSYRERYIEQMEVRQILMKDGVKAGDEVAIAGTDQHVYWARMTGVRITAIVDPAEALLNATKENRARSLAAMKRSGLKAVVGRGETFRTLKDEGWEPVPGEGNYYVLRLASI